MSTARQSLAHKLRIMVGLGPWQPSEGELDDLLDEMKGIVRRERRAPTVDEWEDATRRLVPGAGRYKYAGEDMSDINVYLFQIIAQAGGRS